MALALRHGVTLDDVIRGLRNVATEGRNSPPAQMDTAWHHYLTWVNAVETTLRNYFIDSGLEVSLRGVAHWHIRSNLASDPRWYELLTQEMSLQSARLDNLIEQVKALQARLDAAPGTFAVLDTHVLLHYEPPDQVRWLEVVGEREVRLVIPLRVIEELDAKKYTERNDLADRARRLLAQLRTMLMPTLGLPVPLRENVTIEVPVESGPRSRPLDADYEILQACSDLRVTHRPVVVVTGDTGLALRAANADVKCIPMPERYLRRKPPKEA